MARTTGQPRHERIELSRTTAISGDSRATIEEQKIRGLEK